MKPTSPLPERPARRLKDSAERPTRSRFYWSAASAFIWAPLLPVTLFYAGEIAGPAGKLIAPLYAVSGLVSPLLLVAAMFVLLTSERRTRWLFALLTAGAMLLELFVFAWMQ